MSAGSPPISPLLYALCLPPSSLDVANITATHFATLLFSHLLASSPQSKALARSIKPAFPSSSTASQGQFFVPADGLLKDANIPEPEPEDEDAPQSILPLLSESLSLCFISRSRTDPANDREVREWDRTIVSYLTLLIQWLWEDPKAVREFLDASGLNVVRLHILNVIEKELTIWTLDLSASLIYFVCLSVLWLWSLLGIYLVGGTDQSDDRIRELDSWTVCFPSRRML